MKNNPFKTYFKKQHKLVLTSYTVTEYSFTKKKTRKESFANNCKTNQCHNLQLNVVKEEM